VIPTPPTSADIRRALLRTIAERERDLADATRAGWGASDPATQCRARKLAGARAALADGPRRMTRAEFDGAVETKP